MSKISFEGMRRFFSWSYSAFFVGTFLALWIAMWTLRNYAPAYAFAILAGTWAILHWQFSDFLGEKRGKWLKARVKSSLKPKSNPKRAREAETKRDFFGWNLGVSAVLVLVLLGSLMWMRRDELNYQKTDVYEHLSATVELPPSGDWTRSTFTVTNGSTVHIGDHQIYCGINLIVYGKGNMIDRSLVHQIQNGNFPISPGGDAQSQACFEDSFRLPKPRCVDAAFEISYVLTTQPHIKQGKIFRFVFDENFDSRWHQQPVDERTSPCSVYFH